MHLGWLSMTAIFLRSNRRFNLAAMHLRGSARLGLPQDLRSTTSPLRPATQVARSESVGRS